MQIQKLYVSLQCNQNTNTNDLKLKVMENKTLKEFDSIIEDYRKTMEMIKMAQELHDELVKIRDEMKALDSLNDTYLD